MQIRTLISAVGCLAAVAGASCALRTAAAERLQCPEERIAYATLADGSQLVRGCGRAALLTCYGCRATADLARQAAFELGCPVESLRYEPLDTYASLYAATVGISGCGKRAVYQYHDGQWGLDRAAR